MTGPPTTAASESFRLRRDAVLSTDETGALALRQSRFQLPLGRLGVSRRALVLRMSGDWVGDLELHRIVVGLEGENQLLPAQVLLRRLAAHSWLERRVQVGTRPLLDVRPRGLGAGSLPEARRHEPSGRYRLSRFAALRAQDGHLVAGSPLSTVTVACVDPALAQVLATAADTGCDRRGVAGALGVSPAVAGRVLDELLTGRLLVTATEHEEEHSAAPLAYWLPEELAMHDRARPGRHVSPVGGTYPFRDRLPPAPLRRSFPGGRPVPLAVPDMELVAKRDDSLTGVVRARRSERAHDPDHPLTLDALSEFLYRVQHTDAVGEAGGQEVGHRPYPTGGGLCELEIYPLVSQCDGLEPGLYHYDSAGHGLTLLSEHDVVGGKVVRYARAAAGMTESPQVLLVITARVQRLMWKYEGLSYPMVLKNAGVLTGLMYLVATAMGLAPCALGAGDSAGFARLSGIDPLVEPSIADFALGSRRTPGGQ
ncbi:MAG: SagB family peptide dehydrogenase [Actinoplanes sp.]